MEPELKIYNYDSFNQLTAYYDALSSASYTYNADGLRMSKTVNGEKTKTEFALGRTEPCGKKKPEIR